MMREKYQQIQEKLRGLDFDSFWDGFHFFPFALYDEETVYLADREIPWDERFLANTAINFEGTQIAIWNMAFGDTDDNDVLAANLVHEMFHCFQAEQGEGRFPNDLEIVSYPLDDENFQLKFVENQLLAKYIRSHDREVLRNFVYLRSVRERRMGQHFKNELLIETVEGAAEFVGMQALRQLAPEKYAQRFEDYLVQITQLTDEMFAVRRMAYYTGTLLLLEFPGKCNTNLKNLNPLYETLLDKVIPNPIVYRTEPQLTKLLKQELERRKTVIASYTIPYKLSGKMTGYDPMNMFRINDWVYCAHFVKVDQTFLKGPVLLEMERGSLNRVNKYYVRNGKGV